MQNRLQGAACQVCCCCNLCLRFLYLAHFLEDFGLRFVGELGFAVEGAAVRRGGLGPDLQHPEVRLHLDGVREAGLHFAHGAAVALRAAASTTTPTTTPTARAAAAAASVTDLVVEVFLHMTRGVGVHESDVVAHLERRVVVVVCVVAVRRDGRRAVSADGRCSRSV